MAILLFVLGLGFLVVGAEALVRGSSRMASALGISPLIIGLTVVAFGTSAPELAISVKAALAHQPDIALGNVIGSNIFNVLFILGLSALVAPLAVSQQLIRLDVPLMIGASILVMLLALDGRISRVEGILLFAGLLFYIVVLIKQSRSENAQVKDEYTREFGVRDQVANRWLLNGALVAGGLVLLVLGSKWLVDSAVTIAQYFGVSELVIGLTIVAAGTSLPELVTSVVASLRGERDIAVGNIVGSNLFNLLGVLGVASAVSPVGMAVASAVINFDLPIMIVVAFVCLPIFFTGGVISRWEGAALFGYYIAYTLYLILAAAHHAAVPIYSAAMLYFAIPLTLLTLLVTTLSVIRTKRTEDA